MTMPERLGRRTQLTPGLPLSLLVEDGPELVLQVSRTGPGLTLRVRIAACLAVGIEIRGTGTAHDPLRYRGRVGGRRWRLVLDDVR